MAEIAEDSMSWAMAQEQEYNDRFAPLATPADAHREWHLNAGVPMGTPGCPQDACHPVDDYEDGTWGNVTCGFCKLTQTTVEHVRRCAANHYAR